MNFSRPQGMLLAASGVLVLSFDALLIRLAAASGPDVGFWRGTLVLLSAGLLSLAWRRRGRWQPEPRVLLAGLAAALLYGINSALFVLSISHTQVANTLVILASAPLFAALFSWLFLGERTPLRTLIAIAVAILGVAVVFASSLGQPGQLGDLLALLLALGMGGALTLLRKVPQLPRLPLVAASGLITALLCLPFATPLELSGASYLWLLLMGALQIPLATLLIFGATRHLSAAEVSLFLLIETLLGPLWVWWALAEALPLQAVAGGVLILGAITVNALLSMRRAPGMRTCNPTANS